MNPYKELINLESFAEVLRPPVEEGEEKVVLLQVLQAEVNIGYEDLAGIAKTCNGEKIKNLKHLDDLVRTPGRDTLEFSLANGDLIVLDARLCAESDPEICEVGALHASAL